MVSTYTKNLYKYFQKIFSENKIWRNHKSLKTFLKIIGPVKIYGVNIHEKSSRTFLKIFSEKPWH